jgi:hypothetical protein
MRESGRTESKAMAEQNRASGGSFSLRRIGSRILRNLGLQRIRADGAQAELPPLVAHPLAALLASRVGRPAAFMCPIDEVVTLNGFRFGRSGWHPFSAFLESSQSGDEPIEQTRLWRFYSEWRPGNAAEAIAGFAVQSTALRSAPPHAYHFTPWCSHSLLEELAQLEQYYAADYAEHGSPQLRLTVDGFKYHGPVSSALAVVERRRLTEVHKALAANGYDRSHGDLHVYLLRRGEELRFVCRGGMHRAAAMSALGITHVPAALCAPFLVDIQESLHWPQVVASVWALPEARQYFHHLFDFDVLAWAQARGLS